MATTNEIADAIASEHGLTKTQAKAVVDSVFKQIAEAAKAGCVISRALSVPVGLQATLDA